MTPSPGEMEENKAKITEVRWKTELWYKNGRQYSEEFLRIYSDQAFMDFSLDDDRLPADLETNWQNYLLCSRRFEPGMSQSKTGLTSVWFEARG